MFFRKKENNLQKNDKISEYFLHRDSLTGQMDCTYAMKAFEKLKNTDGYGAVMVHVVNADNMPFYKAVHHIEEAARIVASISKDEVARVEDGYFLIFSKNWEELCEKTEYFLAELSDDEILYATVSVKLDPLDSFSLLMKKLKRRMAAAESAAYSKSMRDLPRI